MGISKEEIEKSISHGNRPYHDVPELGIEGRRDNELRVKQLNLPDVRGKHVVDIGCNSGFFSKWAVDNGAERCDSFDLWETVAAAESVNGHPRIYYDDVNLKIVGTSYISQTCYPPKQIDIMFFFSMFKLLGIPHFLSLADHVIIENNNDKFEDYIMWRLGRIGFKKVEHCGYTTDFGKRSVVKGWK